MNVKTIFPLFLAALLFSGCKKDESETVEPVLAKVKTVAHFPANYTDTYIYGANGKVDTIKGSAGNKQVFTYAPGTVTHTYYAQSGIAGSQFVYYLNTDGLAGTADYGNSSSNMFYDANGFLVRQKQYDAANVFQGTFLWTITENNVTTFYNILSSGTFLQEFAYEYFTDHLNTTGNLNKGMQFLGAQSKNPVKTFLHVSISNAEYNTYEYTYDSNGRITSVSSFDTPGDLSYTETYTYY